MQEKHIANKKITRKGKKEKETEETQATDELQKRRELRKEGRETLAVSPQVRDQSNRVLLKESISRTIQFLKSPPVLLLPKTL